MERNCSTCDWRNRLVTVCNKCKNYDKWEQLTQEPSPKVEVTCNNCTRYGDLSQQDRCIGCNSGSEFILKDLIGKKETKSERTEGERLILGELEKTLDELAEDLNRGACQVETIEEYNKLRNMHFKQAETRIRAIIRKEVVDEFIEQCVQSGITIHGCDTVRVMEIAKDKILGGK